MVFYEVNVMFKWYLNKCLIVKIMVYNDTFIPFTNSSPTTISLDMGGPFSISTQSLYMVGQFSILAQSYASLERRDERITNLHNHFRCSNKSLLSLSYAKPRLCSRPLDHLLIICGENPIIFNNLYYRSVG